MGNGRRKVTSGFCFEKILRQHHNQTVNPGNQEGQSSESHGCISSSRIACEITMGIRLYLRIEYRPLTSQRNRKGFPDMFPQVRFTLTVSLLLTLLAGSTSTAQTRTRTQETITIRVSQGTDLAFDLSSDGKSI